MPAIIELQLVQTIDEALDLIAEESQSTRETFLFAYHIGTGYKIAEDKAWLDRPLVQIRRRLPCQCSNGCYHVEVIRARRPPHGFTFESLYLYQGQWQWNQVVANGANNFFFPGITLWSGFDYGFPSR